MQTLLSFVAPVAIVIMTAAAGAGQTCEDWISGPLHAQPQNLEGYVACATVWQPPTGPPLLVIGGEFTTVGGVVCNNLAAWDGASWRAIGGGTDDRVNALTTYHGELIVGGDFAVAGNQQFNHIARWNGTEWLGLYGSQGGPGIFDENFPTLSACNALIVYQGYLFVTGHFTHAGGAPATNFAVWSYDPPSGYVEWSALGPGLYNADNSFATGIALGIHNGILYVAGRFNRAGGVQANAVASWNARLYSALGSGVVGGNDTADTLLSFGTDLIVGGSFTHAGGSLVNHVARWSPSSSSWSAMGAGIPDSVWALAAYNGLIYAATDASAAIRQWNGSNWIIPFGGGFSGVAFPFCGALTVYNGSLIAGGEFNFAGGVPADSIAQYNGVSWGALQSPTPHVFALEPLGSRMIAAGAFVQSTTNSTPANNLISWDGINLSRVQAAIGGGEGTNGLVRAMKGFTVPGPFGSRVLIVGGDFTTAGGISANRIAVYTEPNQTPSTWSAMGAGFNASVHAIERFNNATYAGGDFTLSGATAVNRIARWTGSAWAAMGSGVNGSVYAMKAYNGLLYIGGNFTNAGGNSTGGLAAWDGNAWVNFGSFFNGVVYSLEVHNGELIIGGLFPGIAGSPNIAKFNGTFYTTLGAGGTNGAVTELRSNGTHVYIAGGFTVAGGVAAQGLARWNATDGWSGVGGGVAEPINALAFFHSELNIGLGATITLDEPESAPAGKGWLRYTFTGAPWVVQHPAFQSVACQAQAVFSVAAATGIPTSYQWRRNGEALSDGPTGHGCFILGAQTPTMTMYTVRAVDAAEYDCVVSNGCGSEPSFAALLTNSCCPGDINVDGAVNVVDLLAVINGWGACAMPPTHTSCLADVAPAGGGDDAVNVLDLLQVINAWGACP
jgi:hypothetical protein